MLITSLSPLNPRHFNVTNYAIIIVKLILLKLFSMSNIVNSLFEIASGSSTVLPTTGL